MISFLIFFSFVTPTNRLPKVMRAPAIAGRENPKIYTNLQVAVVVVVVMMVTRKGGGKVNVSLSLSFAIL